MSVATLILRNLFYYRRQHGGLLLCAMLVCGILTGALIVGDSVRQSLQSIATARLGRVNHAMQWRNRLFSETLAQELSPDTRATSPVLLVSGVASLLPEARGPKRVVNRAQIIGVDAEFWNLAKQPPDIELAPQEAAINEKTASALGVKVGDDIVVRLVKPSAMPLDAPLASRVKTETASSIVTVKAIVSEAQLGRFSLAAEQTIPYNVFVPRKWLQEQVGQPGKANLIVTASDMPVTETQKRLREAWAPEDIGLHVRAQSGLLQLECDRVFIDEEIVRAAMEIPGASPTLTYLVNSIGNGKGKTPYSFVEAGPVPNDMRDDEVVINQWLAEQLSAQAGDTLTVEYLKLLPQNTFAAESRAFRVRGVAAMSEWAIERELAPRFPGLSDVARCSDWSIGMPMDESMLKDAANEEYWKSYKQTPKLMTTYNAGREMWGNQFGSVTAIRFPSASLDEAELRRQIRERVAPSKLGLDFVDVRAAAQTAVEQAMDFGGLFAGMSSFLIIAALILLGLVYSFGIQSRAAETGLMTAVGFPASKVKRVYLIEALPALALGAWAGTAAGVLYARGLIAGLATLWPGAVAGTEVQFHFSGTTLLIGAGTSFVVGFLVTFAAVARNARMVPGQLVTLSAASGAPAPSKLKMVLYCMAAVTVFVIAAAMAFFAILGNDGDLIEPFFMIAALLLICGMLALKALLLYLARRDTFRRPRLWKASLTNLVRRPGRSLSVAGITACGCFIVFSVSSMQENLAAHADDRASGTGGFQIYAETTAPMLGSPADISKGFGMGALPIRVHGGDHAGCLNLNRAQTPPVLGVDTRAMIESGAFAKDAAHCAWQYLEQKFDDGAIPAIVGDSNTAMWGIKKKTGLNDGDIITVRDEAGNDVRLRLVAQLPMRLSVFQGSLLIGDKDFTRLFPSESGFRTFLIEAQSDVTAEAARLNSEFSDVGMAAVPAVDRLQEFYAVESTYLAMFRVLGALGLSLGAGGVSIVILRNLLERRTELATLHAVGYGREAIYKVLLLEYSILVAIGIVIGVGAAALGILPLAMLAQTVISPAMLLGLGAMVIAANAVAVWAPLRVALPKDFMQGLREE